MLLYILIPKLSLTSLGRKVSLTWSISKLIIGRGVAERLLPRLLKDDDARVNAQEMVYINDPLHMSQMAVITLGHKSKAYSYL